VLCSNQKLFGVLVNAKLTISETIQKNGFLKRSRNQRKTMLKSIFQNEEVATIAMIDLAFIVVGLIIAYFTGSYWGFILMALGILLIAYGWKEIPMKPLTIGVLTSFDQMILKKVGDNDRYTTSVKGIVILLPPFLNVIEFDMTNKEWTIEKQVTSIEAKKETGPNGKQLRVPLNGKIKVTVRPDPCDMYDYNQAGGDLDKIKEQLEDIIFRDTQMVITSTKDPENEPGDEHLGLSAMTISQRGQLVSKPIQAKLNGFIEEKDFGIVCVKVQIDYPLPPDVQKAMIDTMSITFETAARQAEFDADIAAAAKFKKELALKDGEKGWEAARQSRLMRDGQMTETVITAPAGVNIFGWGVNPNNPQGQGNKGKGGK